MKREMHITEKIKIAVIGLGYVGLPLARLFSTRFKTIGYDMNPERVRLLNSGHDSTMEVDDVLLQDALKSGRLVCTSDLDDIRECNFYVVAVPTPVDINHTPDLSPLIGASETVGSVIGKGDTVVYESTVYPGVTEEECIPHIEKVSGLKLNEDFYAGYSPERVNPGDKQHTVENIRKITSGSTPEAADLIDSVYGEVLTNGTYKASSIKVAEAAKVIENSQRDINIAFVNELSKIFSLMGIDTLEVLDAAATKWNFIKMNPGLVGGHCISVSFSDTTVKADSIPVSFFVTASRTDIVPVSSDGSPAGSCSPVPRPSEAGTNRPSFITRVLSHIEASSGSCVTMTMVCPYLSLREKKSP